MLNGRKIVQGLVALALLICSIVVSFGLIGHDRQSTQAQSNQVTPPQNFSIPNGNDPWGTAFDSNGNVWVAVPSCDPTPTCPSTTPGKIAVFNPSTSSWITTHQLPSGYAQPFFLTFDGQGRVWFAMPMNNSIGMYDPAKNTFQKWAVPTASSGPWDVAVDHNGMIWFTEHYGHKIGRFNPSTHTFKQIATPSTISNPYGITVDANNNIWFTENNSAVAKIAKYTTGGQLLEYKIRNTLPGGSLTPHLITVDPNGNIWWTEGFVGELGRLIVSQAVPGTNKGVTEYPYHQCSGCEHTSGISFDSNGLIWFDDSLENIFGSFPDSGSGTFSIYNAPPSNSHPHDGLDVDNQNRIWFDEEFANNLTEAIQSGVPNPTPTSSPSGSPSPSPTNTTTPSPTPTLSPTATPSPGTTLAQDTFVRPNQTHWGTASDGQTWGGDANSLSVFTIFNNTGQVSSSSGSHSAVLGPVATNAQVLFSGSLSNFTSNNLGAVLRWKDSNNWYKAYIDGTNLVIQKKVSGTSTNLATVPFAAKAGTSYTLQFTVIGTSLSASVWTGSTTPTTVTATDSTLQSGQCGLRMLVQNSAVATITSFIAKSQ